MNFYLCFSTILICINLTLQIYGRCVAHESKILGCTANGTEWLYTTRVGEGYITAHMIQIIMQAVMLEKALYKVPHESGWFENESKHTELGSSDEEDHNFDEVDNESDYGWEEEEVPVQQDVEKEKLQSRVKTEPLGMHLFAL